MQDHVSLIYQRAALSWHAVRNRRGRAVALTRDAGMLCIHDGVRRLFIPSVRRAARYKGGIGPRVEEVAAKYVGGTGYVPREGDVIIDIGAGIGEFTLWCADAGARVIAFEPDRRAFLCLSRNVAGTEDVQVHDYALWKERGRVKLYRSLDTDESTLIAEGSPTALIEEVEAWSLDALPLVVGLPVIDFMKIDAEGVEPEILVGGIRTLRRTRVVAIDLGASGRRPNLAARIDTILDAMKFRTLQREGSETVLALNTAMVGPFSNRVADPPRS
jgi:FkbM family methyltransferase